MSKKVFRFKKRWMTLIAFTLIVSSVVVFRHAIFKSVVEAYLGTKMKGYGGWKFSYECVHLSRNSISLGNVSLKTKSVGATVHVENFSLILEKEKGLNVSTSFLIEEPTIEVEKIESKGEFALTSLMKGPLERYKVDVADGVVKFVDAEGRVDIFFSLEGDRQRRSVGIFYLSEMPPENTKASAMVKLYQWPKELIVESELATANLVWLYRIVNFFQPGAFKEWTGLEGVVSGHSWIGFNHVGDILQTTANVEVESFACQRANGDLELKVEELSLDFSFPSGGKKIEKKEVWWQSLAMKSQLVGGMARFKDAEWGADFSLFDIEGSLNFSTFKDSRIELKGFLRQSGEISPVVLSGSPSLADREALDIDMRLFLEPNSKTSTHLNLSVSSTEENVWLVRSRLKEMDSAQIKMFQHLIGFAIPEVKDVHFNQGGLSCELSLVVAEGKLSKLLLENMVANDLELYWASQDVSTSAKQIDASAQLDLISKEKFKFPSWRVKIDDGEIIKGVSGDTPLKFSDINLEVFMCRDVFEPSWVNAKVEQIEVALDIVGYFSEANLKVKLATPLERAIRFFDGDKATIHEKFGNYGLAANFDLRRQLGFWDVTGGIQLDVHGDWVDQVDLGFHLSDDILQYENKEIATLIQESVSRGTLKAKNISCELAKVIQHFAGGGWDLEGMVSFDGLFSSKSIDLEIESSYLNLMTDHVDVRLNSVLDAESLETSEGKIHYDFESNHLSAYLPLYSGVIMEKGLGLLFSDTKGDLYYDGKRLRFEDVSCETDGLLVEGNLDLILTPGEEVKLRVETQEVTGSAKNLETFLKNIDLLKEVNFPFQGDVVGQEDGLILSMVFHKDGPPDVAWEANFSLLHGLMPLTGQYALKDLRFDFSSQSYDKKLQCSNLTGKILNGENITEYILSAREVEVDYSDEDGIVGNFDLRLENSMMDLVRVVGGYEGRQKKLYLEDDLTHVLGNKLSGIKVGLTDEYVVDQFDCSFNFSVEELALGLRLAQDLNLDYGLSEVLKGQANAFTGHIDGRVTLNDGSWKLGLDSQDLSYLNASHVPFSLEVKKEENVFHIEKSYFGQMSCEGALIKEEDGYALEGFQLTYLGEKLEFGRGVYKFGDKVCSLPLAGASLNLSNFMQWGPTLFLDGVIELAYTPTEQAIPFAACYKGELTASDLGKENLVFASMTPVHIEYSRERGFLIKDSSFCMEDGQFNMAFEVPTLVFLSDEKICQGYRLKTRLTNDLIQYLALQSPFSDDVDKVMLTKDGQKAPELLFDFEYAKGKLQVGGILPKGVYYYKGQRCDLDEVNFHWSERGAELSGGVDVLGKKFGVHIKTHPYNQFDTLVEVMQLATDETHDEVSKQALYVECKLRDEDGLSVQKIEGDLFGLDFHFVPKAETGVQGEAKSFLGSLKFDMEEMRPLLNKGLIELVDELKLVRGYELSGELSFEKPNYEKPVFKGFFKGRDFDLLGLQFKTCFSTIQIDDKGADIRDVKVSDDAITVDLKEIKLAPDKDGDLSLTAPEMHIRDLRPSLLQKRGKMRGRIKPFHIKNMVINEISGKVSDPTTIKGKGHLNFVNTFKEGTNLLDIPIEIISRLGLDIGLLVPIQGEMDYVLKDGKLIFNKLKNSYSDNKRSYFFLWNKTESYVDFDGNIHIDIRMKQYVLFKITELFVLSINGTLEHPKFALK